VDRAPHDQPVGRVEQVARSIPVVNRATVGLRRARQARWERTVAAVQERHAAEVFEQLLADDDFYERFL
jgi:hypothetical protein